MTEKVEAVERARARARRPGPNFWLGENKPLALGYTSLIFKKYQRSLELECSNRARSNLEGNLLGLGSSGICTRAWHGIELIGLSPPLKRSTCGQLL